MAIALVVLVVTFGSLVAAGMTMLNALIGVGAGMAGLFALSSVVHLTSTAPVLALMLGLAVGIDYSLFISSRYRQNLLEGLAPDEAAGRAVGTAGSAVVFAGATVVIALAGLAVVNIPFLTVMGLAAAGTVAVAVLVAHHPAAGAARPSPASGSCPGATGATGPRMPGPSPARASASAGPAWSSGCACRHRRRPSPAWARSPLPAADMRLALPGRERRPGRHPGPRRRRPDHRGLRTRLQRPPGAGRLVATRRRRRPTAAAQVDPAAGGHAEPARRSPRPR